MIETPCWFGPNSKILSDPNASLIIGNRFINTANLRISNRGKIMIGCDCLVSWDTLICDTDFHQISYMENGEKSNPNGCVFVGNHVWMGAESTLLKGSKIPDGCVVGYRSMVNKAFSEQNCLLAGSPAVVKKQKIYWNR